MTKKELQTLTIAELKGLAKKSRVEITAKLKADIIEELSKGLKKTAKPKKAAPKKKTTAKKPAVKKPAAKKPTAKKPGVKKPVKKTTVKKAVAKKAAPKKPEALKPDKPVLEKPKPEIKAEIKTEKKPEAPKTEKPVIPKAEAKPEKKTEAPKPKPVKLPHYEPRIALPAGQKEVPLLGRRKDLDIYPLQPVKGPGAIKGENSINALAVEPGRAFLYWKVVPESMAGIKGDICIRVYEITGLSIPVHSINFSNANMYYDIPVNELSGNKYLNVTPGKEYFVDIGIKGPGGFTVLGRSHKVSTPVPGPAKPKEGQEEEAGLPEGHFKFRPEGFYE